MPSSLLRRLADAAAVALFLICAGPVQAQQASSGGDSTAQRLGQLEEQMVDLQVTIGTLQSLVARGAIGQGAAPAPAGPGPSLAPTGPGGDSDLGGRVDVIETQIRALTSQIAQLAEQLGQLQGLQGGAPQSAPGAAPNLNGLNDQPAFGTTTVQPSQGQQPAPAPGDQSQSLPWQPAPAAPAQPSGWGPSPSQPDAAQPGAAESNSQVAALPSTQDARTAYEEAYRWLGRQDFAAAEKSFQRFLASYPNDQLADDAQYWLGESYYVRKQYKQAADTFLTGYRKYPSGNKAPDSLLRLGMSLKQLGQTQAACETFAEVKAKFPNASDYVATKAAEMRKESGC